MDSTCVEFDILDAQGKEYHRWASDVKETFIGKDFSVTIFPPEEPEAAQPTQCTKSRALMFLRRHIDSTLRWQYMDKNDPKELWDALAERFSNVHELLAQWDDIRLLKYKTVEEYHKDMLCLRAKLSFCGVKKSEDDLIQKTLLTFPKNASALVRQYRQEYKANRIATFSTLMTQVLTKEKDRILLDQNNIRPPGRKRVPESNHNRSNGGKAPRARGRDRAKPYACGDGPRRGSGNQRRGKGRGGRANVWKTEDVASGHRGDATKSKKQSGKPNHASSRLCHQCGSTDHWFKNCRAPSHVVNAYKKYKDALESNCMEHHNVNLTIADFKESDPSLDAPDFDVFDG